MDKSNWNGKLNKFLLAALIFLFAVSQVACGQPEKAQANNIKVVKPLKNVRVVYPLAVRPHEISLTPEELARLSTSTSTPVSLPTQIPLTTPVPQPVITSFSETETLPSYFSEAVQYWWCLGKIQEWADAWGVDRQAVATIIQIESCGHPGSSSSIGAMGLFQVMPFHFGQGEDGWDIETNAKVGMEYFTTGVSKAQAMGFSGLDALAEAAKGYNWGHNNIGKTPEVNSEPWRFELWFRGFMTGNQEVIDLWYFKADSPLCEPAREWLKTQPPCQSQSQLAQVAIAPQTQPTLSVIQSTNQGQIQLSWPTNAPRVGVPFGQPSIYQPQGHTGIDFGLDQGSPVYAAGDGIVVFTGWFPQGWTSQGHGNTIWIYHGLTQDGKPLYSVYAHLSQFLVKIGDQVQKGQLIAYSGSTGAGSGPHLHFAIRLGGGFQYEGVDSNGRAWSDGQWVNPDDWVR